MTASRIRILLVGSPSETRPILRRLFDRSDEVEVVGTAASGREALRLIPNARPDVLCVDQSLPADGAISFTQEIVRREPLPILIIARPGNKQGAVFPLLEAGALDVFSIPDIKLAEAQSAASIDLIRKVRILAGVRVTRRNPQSPDKSRSQAIADTKVKQRTGAGIIAFGASTGGPIAYERILSQLPSDLKTPVVCVQHIANGFVQNLVQWLNPKCALHIKQAEHGEVPVPGVVYFAPDDRHLEFTGTATFKLTRSEPAEGHRPSVTTLFKSVAVSFGRRSIGVVLTGMGRDGADGLIAIRAAGGQTIAQDESTSVVFGMPKQAINAGAITQILPLDEISDKVCRLSMRAREIGHA